MITREMCQKERARVVGLRAALIHAATLIERALQGDEHAEYRGDYLLASTELVERSLGQAAQEFRETAKEHR